MALTPILQITPSFDGVIVSGGEPTIHEGLPDFLLPIKDSTGLDVKLDTNGSSPAMLEPLLEGNLVDAVSMDVKAPWSDCRRIARGYGQKVRRSLETLRRKGTPFEVRTNFVQDLMTMEDLQEIRLQVGSGTTWVIRLFRPGTTLDSSLRNGTVPDRKGPEKNFPGTIEL